MMVSTESKGMLINEHNGLNMAAYQTAPFRVNNSYFGTASQHAPSIQSAKTRTILLG